MGTFKERMLEKTDFGPDRIHAIMRETDFMAGAKAALLLAAEEIDRRKIMRAMMTPQKTAEALRALARELEPK